MTPFESLPSSDIKKLSDEELEKYLEIAADGTTGKKLALEELTRRRLRSVAKTHRTPLLRFSVAVIAIIIAAIAAILIVRRVYQADSSARKGASLPQQQSSSKPSE